MSKSKGKVEFIYSIKAKLFLMGGIALVGIVSLSILVLIIISSMNEDYALTKDIQELQQIQQSNMMADMNFIATKEQTFLVDMVNNLENARTILNQIDNELDDVNEKYNKLLNENLDSCLEKYRRIDKLSGERGYKRNVGVYSEFLASNVAINGYFSINNYPEADELRTDFAKLDGSVEDYTNYIVNGVKTIRYEPQIEALFHKLIDNVPIYITDIQEEKEVTKLLKEKQQSFDKMIEIDKEVLELRGDVREENKIIEDCLVKLGQNVEEKTEKRNNLVRIVLVITLIIVTGIVTLVIGVVTKHINNNLQDFGKMLQEVANGNLKVRSTNKSSDEFGVFSLQLDAFVIKLSDVINHIQELIDEVGNKNLVVANIMKHIARGEDSNKVLGDEGVIYLKTLSSEINDNVLNQTANTEESLAAIKNQLELNGTILSGLGKTRDISLESFKGVEEGYEKLKNLNKEMQGLQDQIKKMGEEVAKILTVEQEKDPSEVKHLGQNIMKLSETLTRSIEETAKNTEVALTTIESATTVISDNSKEIEQLCCAIEQQKTSLDEIAIAIEQISNDGSDIGDKTKMTKRVSEEIANELIDGVETVNEVINSSQELRDNVSYFKI